MAIDPLQLRRCLGHFATGVTVVTCGTEDGTAHGATVNAFTAVSLDPPLILVSLSRKSRMSELIEGRPFTINVLEAEQRDIATHFGGRPSLQDIGWTLGECGTPRLLGSLAYISCTPWRSYDGGDHVLYLGEVQNFTVQQGMPLLFHSGEFHDLPADLGPVPWNSSADAPWGTSWFGGDHDDRPVGRISRRRIDHTTAVG